MIILLVYWLVFSAIFKSRGENNIPFIVSFACAFIPWTMFSETVYMSCSVIISKPHLVTKAVFPTEILPVITLVANLITHFFMLIFLVIILALSGIAFSFWNLQFLYYLVALSIYTLGMAWIFSAINVIHRDIAQILNVVLTIWFWITPIVWVQSMAPNYIMRIIKLNPMLYIVEGYRDAFIRCEPFWKNTFGTFYFWSVGISLLIIGGYIFKKLKPEFAEIL
jgi:lipopolysaccharide transport system permease protein/teichoic acid transport system permease protein